ncbi:MAG: hypothetical protein OHK0021_11620 [Bryobacter sp.]
MIRVERIGPEAAAAVAAVAESVRYRKETADGQKGYLVFVGTEEEYRERLSREGDLFWGAWRGEELVGFLICTDFGEAVLVDQIGVSPKARGLGVAAKMMERLHEERRPAMLFASIMHRPQRNERSISFFTGRWGFQCEGEYEEEGFVWGRYEWWAEEEK